MKLTYRGVSFTSLIAGVPATETAQTGTFLGKQYVMKQPQVSFRQPPTELMYRGVPYSR